MHHIFLSYSRRDRAAIDDVVSALQADPSIHLWIDERDIPVSVPWFDEVEDAIRGAALVVVCESFAWHESPNCLIEGERASALAKAVLYVDAASHDIAPTMADVHRELANTRASAPASELLVRAAQWDRGGRRRSGLASRRALRSYLPVAAWYGDRLPADAEAFVARSRSYQRRRRIMTAAGVTLVVALLAIGQLFNALDNKVKKDVAQADQRLEYQSQANELAQYNIYPELDDASRTAVTLDRAALYRDRLTADLGVPVPIRVTASTKKPQWPLNGRPGRLTATQGDRVAASDGLVGTLTISVGNTVSRRVQLGAASRALAWGHRGTIVAAATSHGVELVNALDGAVVTTLAGFPRLVRSLSWSNDDRQITARAIDNSTATWNVTSAKVISHGSSDWFVGLAAIRATGEAVAVTRDGHLVAIDEHSLRVIWRTKLGAGVYVGVTARGNEAVVVRSELDGGTPGAVLVDVGNHATRTLALGGCDPRGAATGPAQPIAALACGTAGYGFLDLTTGRLALHHSSTAIVSAAWTADAALFGTIEGTIHRVPLSGGTETTIFSNECAGGVEHMATTPDGHYVLQAGDGADGLGCAHRGTRRGGASWHFDVFAFRTQPGWQASAIAVSPDGRDCAVGFSDGTVRTSDVADLNPRAVRQDALGEVRGLAYSDDGRNLLAVTRDGEILAYSTLQDAMTVAQLDKVAASRVAAARAAGVYS